MPSDSDTYRIKEAKERFLKQMGKQLGEVGLPGESESEEGEEEGNGVDKVPVQITSPVWSLTVVPHVGGRITSMRHLASGREWLEGRMELGGYEEYSGTEYRSPGCTENYDVVRIVCLRVHPSFGLQNPLEAYVEFTSMGGERKELRAEFGEAVLRGEDRPNGEWRLVDESSGWVLVNTFHLSQVDTCFVHWGGHCNLELWSQERPVSVETPIVIEHEYRVIRVDGEK